MAAADRLAPGVLLVAPPVLDDPNFVRSVVLVCQADEEGAFGLVLNQTLDLSLAAVLDGFERYDAPIPLRQGGPVQPETLHVLHRRPDLVPGGEALPGGVTWGGDFDALQAAFADGADSSGGEGAAHPADFAFFLGYAGWSPGQLDAELERGDWLLATSDPTAIFDVLPDALWGHVLRAMGPPHSYLVHFPADPRMN